MIPVGEALETEEAVPITVPEIQDHKYCVASAALRRPTVKKQSPELLAQDILVMLKSLLNNRRSLGKLVPQLSDDVMLVVSQWDEMQELGDSLKLFRVAVDVLSKAKHVMAPSLLVLRSENKDCLWRM